MSLTQHDIWVESGAFVETDAEIPGLKVQMFEPPDQPPSLIARANEHIRRLEADRAQLLTIAEQSPRIRAWDWLFNLPHRITLWWDDLNELGRISSVVGLIAVCAVVGLIGVEVMR